MKLSFFAWATVALCACSSIDKPAASTGTGAPNANGGGVVDNNGGGDGGTIVNDGGVGTACSNLTQSGTLVDVVAVAGDPPTSTGGSLVDGTYVLTDDSIYVGLSGTPGPLGSAIRSTIRISGGGTAMERIVDSTDQSNNTTTQLEVLSLGVSATNLVLSVTCPTNGLSEGTQFTTDGSNLFITNYTTKERRTYALR